MEISKPEVVFHSQKNTILNHVLKKTIFVVEAEPRKTQNREKRRTLKARFGQTEMNLEKIKHGFFRQRGQLDNPETVLRNSWRSGRIFRFFEGHFCLPREEKRFFLSEEFENGTLH